MTSDTDEDATFEEANQNIEDDNEENESNKRRRLTSKVWEEMERIQTSDGPKVQCNHCGKKLKDDCGTSHLRRHLSICQKRPLDFAVMQTKKSEGISTKDFKFSQEVSRRNFIEFLVCGKHPFALAEERKFREFMHSTNPKFKNLSRHTVRRDLFARYDKEKEFVKNQLVSSLSRISLTTDNWRSEFTVDEYICITVHWVNKDWKLKKRIIHFRVLKPPFDGISIADEVARCLSEWGIDNKLFSITLDNASYNNVMANSLKLRLVNNRSLVCDGKLFKIRCCSHILNLIVQAGLSLVEDIVSKVRNGVKYLKNSVSRKKKFYEIAENSYYLNPNKKLRTDVTIRWNSTFLMLDHVIYFKLAWQCWGRRDNTFNHFVLSEEEWEKVQLLHQFLKVFYDVTNLFSASKTPTANVYFRGVWKVHTYLLQAMQSPHNFMSNMVSQMKAKFDKYWTDYSLVLSCAAVLDPRYKFRFLEYCYQKVYGDGYQDRLTLVSRTLSDIFEEYNKNFSITTTPVVGASSSGGDSCPRNDVEFDLDDYEDFLSSRSSQSEQSQLRQYLDEKNLDHKTDIDVLEYWKKASLQYPILSLMARDILAIPVSTVPSESTFSIAKKVISPTRSSLNPRTIESLICLEDWIYARDEAANLPNKHDDDDHESDCSDDDIDSEGEDGCHIVL